MNENNVLSMQSTRQTNQKMRLDLERSAQKQDQNKPLHVLASPTGESRKYIDTNLEGSDRGEDTRNTAQSAQQLPGMQYRLRSLEHDDHSRNMEYKDR